MTVRELAELLQALPPNAIAMYYEGENGNRPVHKITVEKDYLLPVDVAVISGQ
jgi:hypothetical protein